MLIGTIAGIVAAAIVVLIVLFKLCWRVAEPNEALIISGSRHRTEGLADGLGFRVVTGRGRSSRLASRWSASSRSTSTRPTWTSSA